ncbi:chloride channel [Thamnocephalis sphaerospora]|uniref:Chloride channel protein n=1 Tax=Thamnocephalis sphaerospora TaxID=78915 RepID=A0A4P9XGM9_9FUNG|nr:chloride channel [Thamnocephalis sphaerospora]|eukprot:RKP04391.1 chloride channel [Thamnocephalis sphaerospora]
MTEMMSILFQECENGDFMGLCQRAQMTRIIWLLLAAVLMRTAFTTVSYGCKVPAGIFVPSMAVGACFGRIVGILVQAMQHAYPDSFLFSSCQPDVPCITPGAYAFLGAAAALCGVTKMTVSLVVIMFELTGALSYILPTMIVAMVAKAVGDRFYMGGIYPLLIRLYGLPFLDKEEHTFNAPVSAVMVRDMGVFTATNMHLDEIEQILAETDYKGFPIVDNLQDRHLLGYISRSELRYCIDKARRLRGVTNQAMCYFSVEDQVLGEDPEIGSISIIEFGPWVDQTPITVHPKLALEVVLDLFKNLGPRVILVEEDGCLIGLVTKKDVLKAVHRRRYRTRAPVVMSQDASPLLRSPATELGLVRRPAANAQARQTRAAGEAIELST